MNILDNRKTGMMFECLAYGSVFVFNEEYYMKVYSDCENEFNAVDLSNGDLRHFGDFSNVDPVEATLTIE